MNSHAMEMEGLLRSLSYLSSQGLHVTDLVTDQHPSIAKMMPKDLPNIRHWFDSWHVIKGEHNKPCDDCFVHCICCLNLIWVKFLLVFYSSRIGFRPVVLRSLYIKVSHWCISLSLHDWYEWVLLLGIRKKLVAVTKEKPPRGEEDTHVPLTLEMVDSISNRWVVYSQFETTLSLYEHLWCIQISDYEYCSKLVPLVITTSDSQLHMIAMVPSTDLFRKSLLDWVSKASWIGTARAQLFCLYYLR